MTNKLFSNYRNPTPSGSDVILHPWQKSQPDYLVFDRNISIKSNYKLTYNVALDEWGTTEPSTTTTAGVTTSTATSTARGMTTTETLTTTTSGVADGQQQNVAIYIFFGVYLFRFL